MDKFVKNYIDKHNGTFVYLRSQSSTLHVLSNIKTDEKYVLKLLLKKENYLGNLDMLKRRFKDIGAIDEIELVPIQEVGIDAKQFYKLYKYQKQSLAEYIENKILTVLDAVKIFEKILLSVEVLHKQGKAHGNLKLSNIFVDNEKKFVFTDFGFEKQIEDDRYRLPKDSKFTPMKQDIYSLGIIFYELLSWENADNGIEKKIHIPGNLYRVVEKACIEYKLRPFRNATDILSFLKYSTSTQISSVVKKDIKDIQKQDKDIEKEGRLKSFLFYALIYTLLGIIITYLYFLN